MKRRKKEKVEITKGKASPKKKLLKPTKTTPEDKARKAKRTGYRFKTDHLKNKDGSESKLAKKLHYKTPTKKEIEKYKKNPDGSYPNKKIEIYHERRADRKHSDDSPRDKFKSGGKIPNNYKGKTAEEVWNEWTEEQRTHFCEDHKIHPRGEILSSYKEIKAHPKLKDLITELNNHVEEGQYKFGGSIKGFLKKVKNTKTFKKSKKLAKHGFEKAKTGLGKAKEIAKVGHAKAKEGYGKAKKHVEDKIHDKKKDLAIDVIEDTRHKSSVNKSDSQILKEAENIVDKKFEKGGEVDWLSIADVEAKLGRKLHFWNDDMINIDGKIYEKCFMRPYYKPVKIEEVIPEVPKPENIDLTQPAI
ncbi:MAG TPA: hypothetical protein VN026_13615 [Bacteroidia bacterium]|jgi:hypothetical protein|nr:hypothetical protein [Bacteroidia bacterium]